MTDQAHRRYAIRTLNLDLKTAMRQTRTRTPSYLRQPVALRDVPRGAGSVVNTKHVLNAHLHAQDAGPQAIRRELVGSPLIMSEPQLQQVRGKDSELVVQNGFMVHLRRDLL
jgi:hypothetical protein